MDTRVQIPESDGAPTAVSANRIRWRYWRTSLAFWLGLILGLEGSVVLAVAVWMELAQNAPESATMLLGGIGLPMTCVGYGMFFHGMRRGFRRARLLLEGVPLVGAVAEVKVDWWVNYWDHHPAYLKYAFLDEVNQKHIGSSPYLVKNGEKRWQAGDPILVLVDRDDPRQHEVDVDDVRRAEFRAMVERLRL